MLRQGKWQTPSRFVITVVLCTCEPMLRQGKWQTPSRFLLLLYFVHVSIISFASWDGSELHYKVQRFVEARQVTNCWVQCVTLELQFLEWSKVISLVSLLYLLVNNSPPSHDANIIEPPLVLLLLVIPISNLAHVKLSLLFASGILNLHMMHQLPIFL